MLSTIQTYRRFIISLLFCSYFLGSIGTASFEVLHTISHLPAMLFSGEHMHSYTDHEHEEHGHEAIDLLKNKSDSEDQTPLTSADDLKKKIEINENSRLSSLEKIKPKSLYPIYSFQYTDNTSTPPNPPPWFHFA